MTLPPELLEAAYKGDVIPFAGAGVSMDVRKTNGDPSLPRWKDLLLAAAADLEARGKGAWANTVRAHVDEGEYLDAARVARERMTKENWASFLMAQFRVDRGELDPDTLALPRALWELSSLVVTTNYDRNLRYGCPRPDDFDHWVIEASAEMNEYVRGGLSDPRAWHLHGYVGNPEGIILTPDDYERLYGSEASPGEHKSALYTLQILFSTKRFLFVGFSFDDEVVGAQLQDFSDLMDGYGDHYAIVRPSDKARVEAKGLPIVVIPAEHGPDTLDVLRELVRYRAAGAAGDPMPTP